jgi:hypothetical protein
MKLKGAVATFANAPKSCSYKTQNIYQQWAEGDTWNPWLEIGNVKFSF